MIVLMGLQLSGPILLHHKEQELLAITDYGNTVVTSATRQAEFPGGAKILHLHWEEF
jgi:hypothetical protein